MKLIFILVFVLTSKVECRSRGHSRHHGSSHHYSHSTGLSGHGSSTHQVHTYPHSTGLSGNSNNVHQTNVHQTNVHHTNDHQPYHGQQNTVHHTYNTRTVVHHYHYSPPQQIHYGAVSYPVYHGTPPVYIYEYRNSGSRFDSLLTGLALYNLGRSHSHHYDSERRYSGTPGEICKLGISQMTGQYEETRIDCTLMSSFIWEAEANTGTGLNQQHVKTITTVNVTQNGTLNTNSSVVSVTSETVSVMDALQDKGPSIAVTPGMTCYMIRSYRDTTTLRKPIDCGVLQEYARSSLHPNSAQCLIPLTTIVFNCLIYFLIY